ncbi:glycosyltransferase [Pleurocapsa sp. PCC 7319]|uniref:glycosyltransferase n=1 Tax=Pleurocapsa sp. PCC 7319 TaxID=118161 RepID=UPI0003817399|nr:hypothetical protein [Pleurocapsa sp. PCC 7319]
MSTKSKKIKVLIYGNVFRDYRSQALLKVLLESGHHISLICPDFYRGIKKSIFNFLYLIELLVKASFADVIYLPPMNTRFIKSALWAAKGFRKKLIVEMYTSIYDTYVRDQKILKGKQVQAGSKQAQAMLRRDVLALTKSDLIIHTASHELNYWENLFDIKIDKNKVLIAPNFNVSLSNFQEKPVRKNRFEICWWGTFIPLHGLDNILQALKILKAQKLQFTCSLFGVNNALFLKYCEKIKLEKLDDCVTLRKDLTFSDQSLPQYLVANCNLALGIFGNTDKAYNTVPNKLIESLSMGIPTLTMNSPALDEFFEPKTDLWTCQPTPESIAESILPIANGTASAVDWERTRQKVLATFSLDRYQEVVNQALGTINDGLFDNKILDFQNNSKIYGQKVS